MAHSLCYDRGVPYLPREDIEVTAMSDAIEPPRNQQAFVDSLLEVGLARMATVKDRHHVKKDGTKIAWKDQRWSGRVYLAGAAERVGYLLDKQQAGAVGGRKSGESRRNRAKHSSSTPQARRNPSVPDPSPDPVLTPDGVGVPDPPAELEPPPPGSLREGWEPDDTPENRAAADAATSRGVIVSYALSKFRERKRGVVMRNPNADWRICLLEEFETPTKIREALARAEKTQRAKAAKDREREPAVAVEPMSADDIAEFKRLSAELAKNPTAGVTALRSTTLPIDRREAS